VVRVLDGDTVEVLDIEANAHRVRLAGIDAPETGQAFGTKAKRVARMQRSGIRETPDLDSAIASSRLPSYPTGDRDQGPGQRGCDSGGAAAVSMTRLRPGFLGARDLANFCHRRYRRWHEHDEHFLARFTQDLCR
jgi:hypothetical protein